MMKLSKWSSSLIDNEHYTICWRHLKVGKILRPSTYRRCHYCYRESPLHCTYLKNDHNNNNETLTVDKHVLYNCLTPLITLTLFTILMNQTLFQPSVCTPNIHMQYAMCDLLCEYSMLVVCAMHVPLQLSSQIIPSKYFVYTCFQNLLYLLLRLW